MNNIIKEISARSTTYLDENARADVNTLLNLLADLGEKFTGKRRPITAPGIELRFNGDRQWQSVINIGDWLEKGDNDYKGELTSQWDSIENATTIAIELAKELGVILPREEGKALLFHDKSVPEEAEHLFNITAKKFGFRIA